MAALAGADDIVQLLVKAKANLDMRDKVRGHSPAFVSTVDRMPLTRMCGGAKAHNKAVTTVTMLARWRDDACATC